jgi:V8-like Glu-specific endopeptidase
MERPLLVLSLFAAACGAVPPDGPRVGEVQRPIIGGTVDNGDPAVVLVIAQDRQSESLCTGEVVSPHVVLTAAHCVDPDIVGAGVTFSIFLGSDVNNSRQANNQSLYVDVRETHYDSSFDPNQLQSGHDIGVLITAQPINVTPLPMNRTALTQNDPGSSIRLVGYGVSSGTDQLGSTAGTKRQTTTTLYDFDSLLLYFNDGSHNTCEGDSGGPALLKQGEVEVIAGITSFGDQGCSTGGADTRIDVFAASFVDPYIKQFDGQVILVPPDMAQAPPAHPDMGGSGAMSGQAKPGTVGAACSGNGDCTSGVCATSMDGTGYCTEPCDPNASGSCPDGTQCTNLGPGNFCVRPLDASAGGCSVAAGAPTATPMLPSLALLFALLRARRRRGD